MKVEFPSERAIEDYVWKQLENGQPCPISGDAHNFCLRQKEIKGYGVTDIIKIDVSDEGVRITVLELKNEELKESHISQLYRYMTGIRRVARLYSKKIIGCPDIEVVGELAGPFNPNRGDIVWLLQSLDDVTVYDISLSFEHGFKAEEVSKGWHKGDENILAYKDEVRLIREHHIDAMMELFRSIECRRSANVVSIGGREDA